MWHNLVHESDIKELPPATKKVFLHFYNVSGGKISHPKDHQRFNEFIRYCHAKKVKLNEYQLKMLLVRIGCPPGQAKKLSQIYYYGRELLKAECPYVIQDI